MEHSLNSTAYLSNEGRYVYFEAGGTRILFRGPYSLEKFLNIKEWDHGYIVVDTKFSHSDDPIEDYIDIESIMEDLKMEPDPFLSEIEEVKIRYDRLAAEDR